MATGEVGMPKVSEFFGIVVYIYWRDHGPPHFHAVYGEYEVSISITDLTILNGRLPPRVLGLVSEWATLRRGELMDAWRRAANLEPPGRIDPLG